MKINWKVRFKNPAFVLTFAAAICSFVYQILSLFGIAAPISEDTITQLVVLIVNVLTAIGILVDPTTVGVSDSNRALAYTEPFGGEDV